MTLLMWLAGLVVASLIVGWALGQNAGADAAGGGHDAHGHGGGHGGGHH